jgi:phage baseplate assembly protein W
MRGVNASTGKAIAGFDHLKQSITDILRTPIGSRVMRRDYGSKLFQLVDAPLNRSTIVNFYAATVEALTRWEPRISISRVQATQVGVGKVSIDLECLYTPTGEPILVEGIVI